VEARFSLQQPLHHSRASGSAQPQRQHHMAFNKWVTCPYPNPEARLRLFCLPFAGGGASMFRTWGKALPPTIEVCPVQLPGREERLADPPYTNLRALAESLAVQLQPYVQKPFALFGHSVGALLAFELTTSLRRQSAPMPRVLFLSAHRAPHLPLHRKPLYQLPDAEFLQEVRAIGGTPAAVFATQALLDLVLPALRADFTALDTYRFVPEAPLACPLVLYAGRKDTEAPPQDVATWKEYTTRPTILQLFPGDHFFLRADRDLLLQTTAAILVQLGVC